MTIPSSLIQELPRAATGEASASNGYSLSPSEAANFPRPVGIRSPTQEQRKQEVEPPQPGRQLHRGGAAQRLDLGGRPPGRVLRLLRGREPAPEPAPPPSPGRNRILPGPARAETRSACSSEATERRLSRDDEITCSVHRANHREEERGELHKRDGAQVQGGGGLRRVRTRGRGGRRRDVQAPE